MGNFKSINPPTWATITRSDTVDEKPTLVGFEVWSAGDVKWRDITAYEQTRTFAAPFPVRIVGQVSRVYDTGTTVTAGNVCGLRSG